MDRKAGMMEFKNLSGQVASVRFRRIGTEQELENTFLFKDHTAYLFSNPAVAVTDEQIEVLEVLTERVLVDRRALEEARREEKDSKAVRRVAESALQM